MFFVEVRSKIAHSKLFFQFPKMAESFDVNLFPVKMRGRKIKSVKHFISELAIVIEEADETQFWLEILVETGVMDESKIKDLLQEAGEIVAIMTASRNSAIKNQKEKIK